MLIDRFGRRITYFRISITDRCNLRCVYCLPPDGVEWQPHENILRYEEIAEVVRIAATEGIQEIRITGGEPLIRKNLSDLVRMITETPGITDTSLTSNGLLLEAQIEELAAAGLKRINISMDTLDPEKYTRITRGGKLDRVFAGLVAAEKFGITPIKINAVVMRGVNDGELEDLARLSYDHPWQIRFIEIMPILNQTPWGEGFPSPDSVYFPINEMLQRLEKLGLQPEDNSKIGLGPAKNYRLPGAQGSLGFISPLGESFCEGCNRLLMTADGSLRPCLLSDVEIPIRNILRSGGDIRPYFQTAVDQKPVGHDMKDHAHSTGRCMMQIGG
ncbi:MAG: GTP 3',8-cyclase MoaA [Anaerolineaceae bacterium]|nr:GTP 3',8-cyclase MoaA [Anaerolineaceae bacterium]